MSDYLKCDSGFVDGYCIACKSPVYGWKGDIRYRETRVNSWYGNGKVID